MSLKIKRRIYRMLNMFVRGISHHLYSIRHERIEKKKKTYLKNAW